MEEVFLIDGHATGAVFRPPDSRDFELIELPEVRARLAAGLPARYMVTPMENVPGHVKLNQGAIPQCVASSICIAKSGQDWFDLNRWQAYDDDELYRACGGTGSNGIYTDKALRYVQGQGALLEGGQRRYKMASYLFAPQQPRLFRETLAAALIEAGPAVVAMILPQSFGWDSGEGLQGVQSYHQMCLWGYEGLSDSDYAVFLNSWGAGFGRQGFVRVRWSSMEGGNFQGQYCYGYKLVDFVDERTKPPEPEPSPAPEPGPGPGPDPGPQPETIKVTGYGSAKTLPSVAGGQWFAVLGQFPAGGIMQVSWGTHALAHRERTATSVTVQAPAAAGINAVIVRVEGAAGTGPPLAIHPTNGPGPDPGPGPSPEPEPGEIDVILTLSRSQRGGRYLLVYARVAERIGGSATVFVNGQDMQQPRTMEPGGWANWSFEVPKPARVRVVVKATDGRAGTEERTEAS